MVFFCVIERTGVGETHQASSEELVVNCYLAASTWLELEVNELLTIVLYGEVE